MIKFRAHTSAMPYTQVELSALNFRPFRTILGEAPRPEKIHEPTRLHTLITPLQSRLDCRDLQAGDWKVEERLTRDLLGGSLTSYRRQWDIELGRWRIEVKFSAGRDRASWSNLLGANHDRNWHYVILVWRRRRPVEADDPLDANFVFLLMSWDEVYRHLYHVDGGGQFNIAASHLQAPMARRRRLGDEVPEALLASIRTAQELRSFARMQALRDPGTNVIRRRRQPHRQMRSAMARSC